MFSHLMLGDGRGSRAAFGAHLFRALRTASVAAALSALAACGGGGGASSLVLEPGTGPAGAAGGAQRSAPAQAQPAAQEPGAGAAPQQAPGEERPEPPAAGGAPENGEQAAGGGEPRPAGPDGPLISLGEGYCPRSPGCQQLPPPPPSLPSLRHTPSFLEVARKFGFEISDEYDVGYIRTRPGGRPVTGRDRHLGLVNAADAYARGATGSGQTVLVVDTGIRETHQEFAADRVTVGSTFGDYDTYEPTDAEKAHGTAVAGIIAARRGLHSGLNMQGVAFSANIHFAPIRLGAGGTGSDYAAFDLDAVTEAGDLLSALFYSRFLELADEGGASIINQSFGLVGAISRYDGGTIKEKFRHTAAALAQGNVPDEDKKIIVWAAGNEQGKTDPDGNRVPYDSPDIDAALGVHFPELRKHIVAVVGVDQDGGIASYSNHCGIAKSFCIAAPGSDIIVPSSFDDSGYSRVSGTSFAAPVVSGGLALMRQRFRRQVGNTELVYRLFVTADRTGDYANSDIYGHGLIDLDRATRPLGNPGVPLGAAIAGDSLPLDGTLVGTFGPAAGDALDRALAGREIAFLDELGFPFFLDTGALLAEAGPGNARRAGPLPAEGGLERRSFRVAGGELAFDFSGGGDGGRLEQVLYRRSAGGGAERFLSAGGQPGRLFGPYRADRELSRDFGREPFHSAPHLQFVGDGVGLGGSHPVAGGARVSYGAFRGSARLAGWDEAAGDDNLGALLEVSALGDSLQLQAGVLEESGGFAGISPRGAFGQARGRTYFGGFSAGTELDGRWRARLSAHAGRTDPELRARGIVRDPGPVTTSSFGLAVEGRGIAVGRDLLGLSLSQPLRIESGSVRMRLPVGRTPGRKVVHESFEVGLEPSSRTLDFRLGYERPVGAARLGMALGAERHAGHSRENGSDLYGRLSLDLEF